MGPCWNSLLGQKRGMSWHLRPRLPHVTLVDELVVGRRQVLQQVASPDGLLVEDRLDQGVLIKFETPVWLGKAWKEKLRRIL